MSIAVPYKYRRLKLRTFANPSGIVNLNPNLTINGVTQTPFFRYKGGDASAAGFPPWGYGETLDLQAGTVPTFNDGAPGLGVDDDSVKFNAGGYYKHATGGGDIGTEDFVIELVFKATFEASKCIIGTLASGIGWLVYTTAAGALTCHIQDVSGSVYVRDPGLSDDTWYHVLFGVNRNENSTDGAQIYTNGVLSGSGNFSTRQGTLTGSPLAIGAYLSGAYPINANIAYAAAWKKFNWLQAGAAGQAEIAAIVAERFAPFSGIFPQKAVGTALPEIKTRAFPAYLEKREGAISKLYRVGSEWLRQESWNDKNGVNVKGYLPEPQTTNLITESEDFEAWTKLNAGDVVANDAAVCPDGRTAAASIVADATDTQHGVSIVATLTNTTYTFSNYFSPGEEDWVKLEDTTVADCWCYFNLATGAVGSSGAGATGYTRGPFLGDAEDAYCCGITLMGTAAAHTLRAISAHADGDDDYAGDGVSVYLCMWGAQVEANDYMTSPIITDGATATRLKDQLRFKGDDGNITNNKRGTIVCDVLWPDFDNAATKRLGMLSDGGAAADRIRTSVVSTDKVAVDSAATAGAAGGVGVDGDMMDGAKHEVRLRWEEDNLIVSRDGVDGTPDTSVDIPDDLDRIDIGMDTGLGVQARGLISNLRIYDEPTTKG